MSENLIYLDGLASQPILEPAQNALTQAMKQAGNANSAHIAGWRANALIDQSRAQIARLIGASSQDISFTPSATAANARIFGRLPQMGDELRGRRAIVISELEHEAVLHPAKLLAGQGWELRICRCATNGQIDLDHLQSLTDQTVAIVSVMTASNLTGILQPIEAANAIAKEHGCLFHTDAAQAAGKTEIDVMSHDIDYLTASAHKFGGLQGIGALYRAPHAPSLITETASTAGTPPAALISAMGAAADARSRIMEEDRSRCAFLLKRFTHALLKKDAPFEVWAPDAPRVSGAGSFIFHGGSSSLLLDYVQNRLCLSNASACFSGQIGKPKALSAMGLSSDQQSGFFRIGLGWWNTEVELEEAAELLIEASERVFVATGRSPQ